MRGSLTESVWQPGTDSDEAALTRSFAFPAFTGLAIWSLAMLSLLGQTLRSEIALVRAHYRPDGKDGDRTGVLKWQTFL